MKRRNELFSDFRNAIKSYHPDLIAVSMVEDAFYLGISLLNSIQDLNIPNIVGGVFPTFAPEKALAESCVDMICVGEGEFAHLDLCNALKSGNNIHEIKNIWSRNASGTIQTPIREVIDLK